MFRARLPVAKIKGVYINLHPRNPMSAPNHDHDNEPIDPVEKIVPLMPIVLPVAGGLLMFLLAFIAVFMA